MYVFAPHCPSYYFFKNVIKELQRKDLLKEPVKLADEYLIHHLNFDHSLPSISATLLPSILSKLLFYIQTNEINFNEMNEDLANASNAFNFQLTQDFKYSDFKQIKDKPFLFLFEAPIQSNITDGYIVEIVYTAEIDKFELASLTKVLFTISLHTIDKTANTNSFQYQILKSILAAKQSGDKNKEKEVTFTYYDIPTASPLKYDDIDPTPDPLKYDDFDPTPPDPTPPPRSDEKMFIPDDKKEERQNPKVLLSNKEKLSIKEQRRRAKEWRDNVLRYDSTTNKDKKVVYNNTTSSTTSSSPSTVSQDPHLVSSKQVPMHSKMSSAGLPYYSCYINTVKVSENNVTETRSDFPNSIHLLNIIYEKKT
jgi:hypothetical protein